MVVVFLALLFAGYLVYTNSRGEKRMRTALEKLEAHGITADMQMSVFRKPAKEEDDGGARYYFAAFSLLPSCCSEWSEREALPYVGVADEPQLCEAIAPDMADAIATYCERQKDYFQALEKALAYPEPKYGIRSYGPGQNVSDIISDLQSVGDHQKLFSLLPQSSGQPEVACDACKATLDLSRTFGNDHQLIIQLVGVRWLLIVAHDQIEQCLSRMTPSAASLRSLREAFIGAAENLDLKRMIETELAECGGALRFLEYWHVQNEMGMRALLTAQSEPLVWSIKHDSYGIVFFSPPWNVEVATREDTKESSRLTLDLWRLWLILCPGSYQSSFADRIDKMLTEYEAMDVPDHVLAQRAAAAKQNDVKAVPSHRNWSAPTGALLEGKARCRVATVALSVEIYRATKGNWPQTLGDIERGDLLDPFTGKALKYQRVDGGVIVYSVGENLTDDGGKNFWDTPEADSTGGDDLAFRMFDPERRNVEAPAKSE